MDKAGDLLDKLPFFENVDQKSGKIYSRMFKSWERIVGPKLADYSRIVDLNHKTLVVEVDHPGIIQLLQMKYSQILSNLKNKYPELEINDIRMFVKNAKYAKGMAVKNEFYAGDKEIKSENSDESERIKNIENSEFRDLLLNMKKRSQV